MVVVEVVVEVEVVVVVEVEEAGAEEGLLVMVMGAAVVMGSCVGKRYGGGHSWALSR